MLTRLEISNFAVISHTVFEPGRGLNVITGETGAGKSLLVDALGLIMGDKASRNIIRSDSDNAYVEAVFDITDIDDAELFSFLKEVDIEPEEGSLIISRKINSDGKSTARVNGRTVVLAVLRRLSSFLVDVHGQNDTQVIFDENKNCEMLYAFGGEEVSNLKSDYDSKLAQYKEIVMKIRNLSQSPELLKKRREYLEYAVSEIEEADLMPGIEEELLALKRKMADAGRVAESLQTADECLDGQNGDHGVIAGLSLAASVLGKINSSSVDTRDMEQRLSSALLEIQSVKEELAALLEELDFDPQVKEDTDRKISRIYDLKSKYGDSISDILKFRDDAVSELNSFEDNKAVLADLKKTRHALESDLLAVSERLGDKLKETAKKLESDIVNELADLEMPESVFSVDFAKRPNDKFFSSHGTYDIRFMFTANPGQPLKPLSSIVSGGEASRIMLAVKNILSRCDSIPTLVFDEIDMGVSGKASVAIAYKLSSIGREHQVLCVSHTSQICAAADNNFVLTKSSNDDSTTASVTLLDGSGKVREVSRLLSGKYDDESVNLAKNLINQFRR